MCCELVFSQSTNMLMQIWTTSGDLLGALKILLGAAGTGSGLGFAGGLPMRKWSRVRQLL
jgi:hypothetical protein